MSKKDFRIPIPCVGFHPPVYACKRATEPFVLDGDLNKSFWANADFTEDFVDIEGDCRPVPRFRTRAKMLWDDENIYFGAILEGDEIWATQTEHDCVIFLDNDFEIFIDPDSDTQEYVEYEMNALNTNWDLMLTKAYHDYGSPINGLELKGLRSAVKIDGELNNPSADNKSWSVEVVIPFTTLKECHENRRAPLAGEYYRLNFSRVQWLVDVVDNKYQLRINPATGSKYPEDNWVWAPTGVINIHYPEQWGFLFFTDDAHTDCQIPEFEKTKWDLRLLYYAEHIHKDIYGCFTDDLNALLQILEEESPIEENKSVTERDYLIETTASQFEISFSLEDGKTLSIVTDGKIRKF